jgi:hexokinase
MNDALSIFTLSNQTKQDLIKTILDEYNSGLKNKNHDNVSRVPMLPSYVDKLLSGSETGLFLAFDFGSTNFRVLSVKLTEDDTLINSKSTKTPAHIVKCHYTKFFEYFANCAKEFVLNCPQIREFLVTKMGEKSMDSISEFELLSEIDLKLGFTFSQPCKNTGLTKSEVIAMVMGYDIEGIVGKNVTEMMENALAQVGLKNIKIEAVCNDTVGTLFSAMHDHKKDDVRIGLIVGTGFNISYVEKTPEGEKTVINTEVCALGSEPVSFGNLVKSGIVTKYDIAIDEARPVDQGTYIFEKLTGGMYMGEMVRLTVVDLIESGVVKVENEKSFNEFKSTKDLFDSEFLSIMENEGTDIVSEVETHCRIQVSKSSAEIIKKVCIAVVERSVGLVASAVVATVFKIFDGEKGCKKLEISCGGDGSVFHKHPSYAKKLDLVSKELIRMDERSSAADISVKYVGTTDGSGKGAALIVAAL